MEKELINNMLDKSEEAFLMAIEIYNKPTISYRLEGFSFFICNAWELLLKAKMLKENEKIYYQDKPTRTISLTNCIIHIFTNDKDPIRIVKELRDTNLTHCFNQKRVRAIIVENLKRKGINIKLTQYDFQLICDKFDLKQNEKFFYKHELTNSWGCSQQLIDFTTNLIINNPEIISQIRSELKIKTK